LCSRYSSRPPPVWYFRFVRVPIVIRLYVRLFAGGAIVGHNRHRTGSKLYAPSRQYRRHVMYDAGWNRTESFEWDILTREPEWSPPEDDNNKTIIIVLKHYIYLRRFIKLYVNAFGAVFADKPPLPLKSRQIIVINGQPWSARRSWLWRCCSGWTPVQEEFRVKVISPLIFTILIQYNIIYNIEILCVCTRVCV